MEQGDMGLNTFYQTWTVDNVSLFEVKRSELHDRQLPAVLNWQFACQVWVVTALLTVQIEHCAGALGVKLQITIIDHVLKGVTR
jgi:hypothetical protein